MSTAPDRALVDGVLRTVAEASGKDLVVATSYLVVVLAVVAELAWLRGRRRDRGVEREARTAIGMAAGALLVGAAYTAVLASLWPVLGGLAPPGAAELWERYPVLGVATAFVAWDAAGYAYHALGHRTRIGWAAHRPHHTATHLNLAAGLRQSWMPWHGLLVHPLVALGGWDLGTIAVCAAVSSAWQLLEHTAVPLRFPAWLAAVLVTPEAHRHHHVVDAGAVNLGPVLTVWDRACGTWEPGPVADGTPFGVAGPVPANLVSVQLQGWRQLRRSPADGRPPRPSVASSLRGA